MRILVTAGNTQTLIDRVRAITNIFTGRTGANIASQAWERGHAVELLTSHPELIAGVEPSPEWHVEPYRTYEDLAELMERRIRTGNFDAIIHCAAVSDFRTAGMYTPAAGTRFVASDGAWQSDSGLPQLDDAGAGKVRSSHAELWLRLVPTIKLIDCIRRDWGFGGILVKFKLEVGLSDDALLAVARHSRQQSAADLIVANTLEGHHDCAWIGDGKDQFERIERPKLAGSLLAAVETLYEAGRGAGR